MIVDIVKRIWQEIVEYSLFVYDMYSERKYWTVMVIKTPIAELEVDYICSWLNKEIGPLKYELRGLVVDEETWIAELKVGFRRKQDAVYFKLVWPQ